MSTTTPATNPQLSAFPVRHRPGDGGSPQLSARAPSAFAQLRTLFHRLVEPGTIEDAYGHDLFTEPTAALAATDRTQTGLDVLSSAASALAAAQTTAHLEQLR